MAAHIAHELNMNEEKKRKAVAPQQHHAVKAFSTGCEKGKFENSEMGKPVKGVIKGHLKGNTYGKSFKGMGKRGDEAKGSSATKLPLQGKGKQLQLQQQLSTLATDEPADATLKPLQGKQLQQQQQLLLQHYQNNQKQKRC